MREANVLNCTRYLGSLVLLAIVRCWSSISADPTGFASPKWVLSSFVNSIQLLHHARVRLGSSSNMPCLNHSNAIFFKWLMAKKTLVASIEYCCGYELKVIWHCSKNACRSSELEPLNVSGAQTQDWLVVGGLGGGMAMFWPIVSRGCTNWWTGSIALVDSCTETGGDCWRVGGVCELHNGGGCKDGVSPWPSKSSITGSPSSRALALSRTLASSPSIPSSPGSPLAC